MTLDPHPVRIRLSVCETHPARRSVLIYAPSSGLLRSDPLILARPDSRKNNSLFHCFPGGEPHCSFLYCFLKQKQFQDTIFFDGGINFHQPMWSVL